VWVGGAVGNLGDREVVGANPLQLLGREAVIHSVFRQLRSRVQSQFFHEGRLVELGGLHGNIEGVRDLLARAAFGNQP
jgi:hypothetical protein